MSDYARQHDFNSKTGTTIFGQDVDDEFDAVLTANNSKVDESREGAASGIATLDSGSLIPAGISGTPTNGSGQLPEASTTALGTVELATAGEAQALTDALRAITPDSLDDVLTANAGMAKHIQALADPGVDTLLGWDDSASAAIGFTLGDGIETSGTAIRLSTALGGAGLTYSSGVLSLTATVAGDGLAHSAGVLSVNADQGVKIESDTVRLTDVAAGAAQPVNVLNGAFTFDLSSVTELSIGSSSQSADGFVYNDAGVIKIMPYDESGIKVATVTGTSDTLAAGDLNTFIEYTNGSAVTVTLNTGVGAVGNIIILKQTGAGTVTVAGTATIESSDSEVACRTTDSVISLVCIASNVWALFGDKA